jgi:hypothetical protein
MNTRSVAISDEEGALIFIRESESYAAVAVTALFVDLEKPSENNIAEFTRRKVDLQVMYLFPNLSTKDRAILGDLLQSRRDADLFAKPPTRPLTTDESQHREADARRSDEAYGVLAGFVQTAEFQAKLKPLQKLILEREFFYTPK